MVIVSDWTKFNSGASYTVPRTWLVGEYLLDWNANDTSGNGNNGTATNVTYTTPAWSSVQVWVFNGSSSFIECMSNGFGTHNNASFTVSAWAYLDTLGSNRNIRSYDFTSHTSPFYSQSMRISSTTNRPYFGYNNSGSFSVDSQMAMTTSLTASKRFFICAQVEDWNQKFWLGDVSSLTEEVTKTITPLSVTYYNQEVWIGKANFGAYFDWWLARIRAYDRVLSTAEITDLYDEGVDLLWL